MPAEHEGEDGRVARRLDGIRPFRVMEILARARELERAGRHIVHMEIGEPDFPTPAPVTAAGIAALEAGQTHYTPALGLPALREAISAFYRERFGVVVAPERIAVTPGASGALQLALAALLDAGERVLLPDPGYPCNRHFVRLLGGEAVPLAVDAAQGYQPTAAQIDEHWQAGTAGVVLASPSNPGGALIAPAELARIHAVVRARRGFLLVDEIYQCLVYDGAPTTALELGEDLVVVNSFSKYFDMTGWRLGWLVAPPALMPAIDRLAQNLFLAAPTPAQHAALAAFGADTTAVLERRRDELRQRRDYLYGALRELGFGIPLLPAGAFYLYADCSRFSEDSESFCARLLERAGVAVTPGSDFGEHRAGQHVRFAYTAPLETLREGVGRLRAFLRP
jgi:aspartate/methionine/tyrosine aminotransferase